jgi:hypothetical protein
LHDIKHKECGKLIEGNKTTTINGIYYNFNLRRSVRIFTTVLNIYIINQ